MDGQQNETINDMEMGDISVQSPSKTTETSSLVSGDSVSSRNKFGKSPKGVNILIRQGDSIPGAVCNLANLTTGAGVLFLPFVLKTCGAFLGIAIVAFGGIYAFITLFILYKCFMKAVEINPNVKEYEDVAMVAYGKKWVVYLVEICVFFLCFGCAISYSIIASDLLWGWLSHKTIHAVVLFVCLLPVTILGMSDKIGNLRFVSYVFMAIVIIFTFCCVLLYFTGVTLGRRRGEIRWWYPKIESWYDLNDMISVLGVIAFGYECHTGLCPVIGEFSTKKRPKMIYAIAGSIIIEYSMYCVIATFGYLSFAENVRDDLILSYTGDHWTNSIMRGLILIAILLTYPGNSYITRTAAQSIIRDIVVDRCGENTINTRWWKRFDFVQNIVVSFSVMLVSFAFCVFYPHAMEIFSLVGSSVALFISFILPSILYVKLYKVKFRSWTFLGILCIATIGAIFGVVVTFSTLFHMIYEAFSH